MDEKVIVLLDDLQTGDILLFNEHPFDCFMNCFDGLIKDITKSNYSHAALVIRNPTWIKTPGIFVWESTYHGTKDPQDQKIKFGVQLTPLSFYTENYPGIVQIFCRKCISDYSQIFTSEKLTLIHKNVYGVTYNIDPLNWIEAAFKKSLSKTKYNNRFFCSAFVAYILTQLNILDSDTNWSLVSPQNLSSTNKDKFKLTWLVDYTNDIELVNDI